VYGEARQSQGQSEFLDALVSSPPAIDAQRLQEGGDLSALASSRLSEALRLLAEKGSVEDVDAYKQFVVSVARAAAEAHKEGGFVGIGGKQISEEEQAALDEIQKQLDSATT
jgi:hypothetical protein